MLKAGRGEGEMVERWRERDNVRVPPTPVSLSTVSRSLPLPLSLSLPCSLGYRRRGARCPSRPCTVAAPYPSGLFRAAASLTTTINFLKYLLGVEVVDADFGDERSVRHRHDTAVVVCVEAKVLGLSLHR